MKTNWQHWVCKLWIAMSLLAGVASSLNSASAQITPDSTLGTESSIVKPLNPLIDRIDGGAIRGFNLFHSFQDFNIGEGRSAYFANPTGITNIFSRVTGSNPSQLLGTLGVLGNANLFFLNPNGIIFGPNAKLDMGGSLVTSTANSVIFPDGKKFSASNPEMPPLLTINVSAPVGLEFESEKPGAIVNGGDLGVGQNLSLVGGTVVSTGKLSAPSGELAVVTVPGIQSDGSTPVVNIGQTGQFVNWEMRSQRPPQALQTSGTSQPATPGLTLSQLLANTEGVTGLTVNNGQVELADSSLPVQTGDVAVRELEAQTATLAAEGNLTLVESKLGAKGNLNLLAKDTVRVRDSVANPFLAAAGNKLLLQGNQGVDIFALNHSESGLFSGGDMVLRSAEKVGGDAHYYAGGNFRIEKLDGSLGNLYSPHDPVIRSLGDVSFSAYQGASLHILTAGKVEIPNFVFITSSDTINGLSETVSLSNGTLLSINGKNEPTVDIRSGMNPIHVGFPGVTRISGIFFNPFPSPGIPNITTFPTSADIKLGTISFATTTLTPLAGTVLLTNQYHSNPLLSGDIEVNASSTSLPNIAIQTSDIFKGGVVKIDSRGRINLNGTVNTSALVSGNGGDVTFLAKDDINTSNILSISKNGNGGNISLNTDHNIQLAQNATVNVSGLGGGQIEIKAKNLTLTNGAKLTTSTLGNQDGRGIYIDVEKLILGNEGSISAITTGNGQGGNIQIKAIDSVEIVGTRGIEVLRKILTKTFTQSDIKDGLFNLSFGNGAGGNLSIQTDKITLQNGALALATTFAGGQGGNLNLIAKDKVELSNGSALGTGTFNNGVSGNLTVEAKKLLIQTDSVISSLSLGTGKAGDLFIEADQLIMTEGSAISASSFGSGDVGSIDIVIHDTASLDGGNPENISTGIYNRLETPDTTGNSGSINFKAGSVSLTNGAVITGSSNGQGKAANITINFDKEMSIDGAFQFRNSEGVRQSSGVFATIKKYGTGTAGDIKISSANGLLSLTNGGIVIANTFGQGNAGNIEINVDSLKLGGVGLNGQSSGVFTPTEPSAQGRAGTITIGANLVEINDGGLISSQTRNSENGGLITINAQKIVATRGGQISTSASSSGKAGNIDINANSIILSGIDPNFTQRPQTDLNDINGSVGSASGIFAQTEASGNAGNINITTQNFNLSDGAQIGAFTSSSGKGGNINLFVGNDITLTGNNTAITASTLDGSSGNGGSIFIDPNTVNILDGSKIAVNSQGTGIGGDVQLIANTLNLNNGKISAQTRSNTGGNITFTLQDLLLMRKGSEISTTAGDKQFGGNGGNINIDAQFIVAFPTENSDITANAFQGQGGNIQISTQAIFGLEYRPRTTPNSDITASSDFGVDGEVVINTPGIDPSRGLTPLPDVPINTQIVVGCQAGGVQSSVSFTDVGRTGLPARPDDPLTEETIIADWINPDFDIKNTSFQTTTMNLPKSAANSNETMFKTQLPTVISPCYDN